MSYTPEQLREQARSELYVRHEREQFRAHADALEENARLRDAILGLGSAERQAKELLERAENALATMRPFFDKHALGALAKPSCLCCGRNDYKSVAVQHAELPAIVICDRCKCAEAELAKLRQHAEAMCKKAMDVVDETPYTNGCISLNISMRAYRRDYPEGK